MRWVNAAVDLEPGLGLMRQQTIRCHGEFARRSAPRSIAPHVISAAPPEDVRLVCVSKTVPAERIAPLIDAGERIFGENRVQEAQGKWPALRAGHTDHRTALDRPASDQQGARSRGSIRRDRDARPGLARQGARDRDSAGGPRAAAIRAGKYRRRASESRRAAARDGRVHRAMPKRVRAPAGRLDVHSAG